MNAYWTTKWAIMIDDEAYAFEQLPCIMYQLSSSARQYVVESSYVYLAFTPVLSSTGLTLLTQVALYLFHLNTTSKES